MSQRKKSKAKSATEGRSERERPQSKILVSSLTPFNLFGLCSPYLHMKRTLRVVGVDGWDYNLFMDKNNEQRAEVSGKRTRFTRGRECQRPEERFVTTPNQSRSHMHPHMHEHNRQRMMTSMGPSMFDGWP